MPDEAMPDETSQSDRQALETDARLPSGEWLGFFQQATMPQGRGWMDLILSFAGGHIQGEGQDRVGEFIISGRYHLTTERVHLNKQYVGKHEVAYEGFVEEGRGIWGKWLIARTRLKGGFHIWPKGMDDPTGSKLRATAELPATAEETAVTVEPAAQEV